MIRNIQPSISIARLDLPGCPEGRVLMPAGLSQEERTVFADWDTPLSPIGYRAIDSRMSVISDGSEKVLEFDTKFANFHGARALVSRQRDLRNCIITARFVPLDESGAPHDDDPQCKDARVGIVFRMATSRHYYHFAIENRRAAVLYRRSDDEWFPLRYEEIAVPAGYVEFRVELDGDGMLCSCPDVGVSFFTTDTTWREGAAGIRTEGRSRLASLEISQHAFDAKALDRRRNRKRTLASEAAKSIPPPVQGKTVDVSNIVGAPIFSDFAAENRFDMLASTATTLRASTVDGEIVWEAPTPLRNMTVSRDFGSRGRLIYGFHGVLEREMQQRAGTAVEVLLSKEMIVLSGRTGEVLARRALPPPPTKIRGWDFSATTGALSSSEGTDVVLRECRLGGGAGNNLWAFNCDLELLWHRALDTAEFGHHYALKFFDVDSDGRDELLAGGTLFDCEGRIVWIHEMDAEMLALKEHYDAVAFGNLAGVNALDPTAFLIGGSGGVFVVDGMTGKTRAHHRIGHAQGVHVGNVRPDLPGTEVMVHTRWENYGILTLFSGRGDLLWTKQPAYVPGVEPVRWGEKTLLWINATGPSQGLYDNSGSELLRLGVFSELWGDRNWAEVSCSVNRIGTDPKDHLCMIVEGKMHTLHAKPN